MIDKISILKDEEGFRSEPYKCTEGKLTFGYGKTFITQKQAERCLYEDLQVFEDSVKRIVDNKELKINKQAFDVLVLMCYQLGGAGLLGFKNMWKALESQDYKTASEEMLDSFWYRQTPKRCERMAKLMLEAGNE